MVDSIFGPSIIELSQLMNVTIETLSRGLAVKGIFVFVGALMGGLASDHAVNYLDYFLCGSAAIMGLSIAVVPLTNSVLRLGFVMAVHGTGYGAIGVGEKSLNILTCPYFIMLNFKYSSRLQQQ